MSVSGLREFALRAAVEKICEKWPRWNGVAGHAQMARKNAIRTLVTLECGECKSYTYHTEKNRRNDPDRITLTKFCPSPKCRCRREFREKR